MADRDAHFISISSVSKGVLAAVNAVLSEYNIIDVCWWMGTVPALSPMLNVLDEATVELCIENSAGTLKFDDVKGGAISGHVVYTARPLT